MDVVIQSEKKTHCTKLRQSNKSSKMIFQKIIFVHFNYVTYHYYNYVTSQKINKQTNNGHGL